MSLKQNLIRNLNIYKHKYYFLEFSKNIFFFQNTALHLATMENRPNAIGLLLSLDCKLLYNLLDMSAIDYAIHYKYTEAALAMVTHEER